jgi:hypothetical protein
MKALSRAFGVLAAAMALGMTGCSLAWTPDGHTVGGAAAGGFIGPMSTTNRNGPTGNAVR